MIPLPHLAKKTIAVLGLGKSGLSAARALLASGAEVRAWDDNKQSRQAAAEQAIPLVDLLHCDWHDIDALVLSPGIPHRYPSPNPIAELARRHCCEIIGDVDLLSQSQSDARFVGITGTNGKSTTTSLIGHVLASSGRSIEVGGNLGPAVMNMAALGDAGIYVLELSSYQLELAPSLVCDIAILLNISPDHLDRHGGLAGYIAAKRRIFQGQLEPQVAIVGCDDDTTSTIADALKREGEQIVIEISGQNKRAGGVYCLGRTLVDDLEGQAENIIDLDQAANLPGPHNAQNAAAAYAACRRLGLSRSEIAPALISFPGLAHRQEHVADIDGVVYVNDSKATNAEAAARALGCYDTIYWIIGGRAKETGLKGLERYFGRIAHAFLIGEASETFAAVLDGQVAYTLCGDMDTAVSAARTMASRDQLPGAVVLLSPAAASFDQYDNFEERGEAFRRKVMSFANAASHASDAGRAVQ